MNIASGTRTGPWRTAIIIAVVYLLFAVLWNLLADWTGQRLASMPGLQTRWQAYNPWLFVVLGSGLLLALVHRAWRRAHVASEYWRSIVEHAHQGFWLIDRDSRTILVNQALADMLGYGREEMRGRTPFEFADSASQTVFAAQIGTDDHPGWRHRYTDSRHYAVTLLARDGRIVPTLFHATSLVDGDDLAGSYAFVTDLTEIRRQRRELELTRHALEHSFDAIFRVAPDGRILDVNQTACSRLGHSRDELLRLSVQDLDPNFPHSVWPGHWEKLGSASYLRFETCHRRKDGSTFPVEVGLNYLEHDGEAYGFAICRDITEHNRQLAELRRAATVFEHTVEGIVIADPEQRIVAVNDAFTHITGYSEPEALGQTPALLHSGIQTPEFYESMWEDLRERGVWQGEIWNRRKNGEIYPEWLTISEVRNEAGELTNYIGVFADMTQAHQTRDELVFRTYHDHLTHLPNRVLFQERLDHALESLTHRGRNLAVVMLDIVGFGAINDSLGTESGDEVLTTVGERLRATLRAGDTIARPGGDEFWMVLEDLARREDVEPVLQNLLAAIREPFTIKGQTLRLTARVGAAMAPDDGTESSHLVNSAATALHRSQEEASEQPQYFQAEMQDQVQHRVSLEQALKVAIDQDQLRVWYQPQVELGSGRVVAAEALVRWEHPEWGLVSPAEFLPLAEETGLVVPLGEWVLENAVAQCREWREHGLSIVRVAVNVAAAQLWAPDFYTKVAGALERTGLPSECLELEITEQGFLRDIDAAQETIARLASLGTRLSIDDFGTGYSSLAYLKRLPVDTVKIDKSFVDGIPDDDHDRSIVDAIIAVANALGLELVAEGVERESQANWMRDQGVHLAQGFLYSPPKPAPDLLHWLESRPSAPSN